VLLPAAVAAAAWLLLPAVAAAAAAQAPAAAAAAAGALLLLVPLLTAAHQLLLLGRAQLPHVAALPPVEQARPLLLLALHWGQRLLGPWRLPLVQRHMQAALLLGLQLPAAGRGWLLLLQVPPRAAALGCGRGERPLEQQPLLLQGAPALHNGFQWHAVQ
jgi:hypothetical protein